MIIEDNTSYAVGWFTLSPINAGLVESKGRAKAGWWIASIFVRPIAPLLIVYLDPLLAKK